MNRTLAHPIVRLIAVAALAVAACAPSAAQTPPSEPPQNPRAALASQVPAPDLQVCAARGGTLKPVCRLRAPMCVVPYSDAGKSCSGKADCQGRCVAKGGEKPGSPATGVCEKDNDPCGCVTLVEDGKVAGGRCVD